MNEKEQRIFNKFIQHEQLDKNRAEQFLCYLNMLQTWNKKFNLTTITDVAGIVGYHFQDSLRLADVINLNMIESIADIGAGAGFPGIPLKIKYPHLVLVLIEVNNKKISFLNELIERLALENVRVCPLDWRTFLRKTNYEIDLFCARASLHPDELVRMFKSASPYKKAQLVYWASAQWQPEKKEELFITKEESYMINSKKRRLVFFSATNM